MASTNLQKPCFFSVFFLLAAANIFLFSSLISIPFLPEICNLLIRFFCSHTSRKRPDFLLLIRSFSLSFYLLTFTVKPFSLCRFLGADIQVPGSGTFPHDSNQLFGAQRIADTKACHRIIFGKGAENQNRFFRMCFHIIDHTAAVRLGGKLHVCLIHHQQHVLRKGPEGYLRMLPAPRSAHTFRSGYSDCRSPRFLFFHQFFLSWQGD